MRRRVQQLEKRRKDHEDSLKAFHHMRNLLAHVSAESAENE